MMTQFVGDDSTGSTGDGLGTVEANASGSGPTTPATTTTSSGPNVGVIIVGLLVVGAVGGAVLGHFFAKPKRKR